MGADADEFTGTALIANEETVSDRANLDSLADRLREVRRQLTRGRQLANAFGSDRASPAALRAAERLNAAVRWLDETAPPPRSLRGLNDTAELPWLVRVVELRAAVLKTALEKTD